MTHDSTPPSASMLQADTYDAVEQTIDKSRVPSIQQKRLLAFVNHFVLETADFLNRFAASCESKFVDFEVKLDRVEDSLMILEIELSSIPELADCPRLTKKADLLPVEEEQQTKKTEPEEIAVATNSIEAAVDVSNSEQEPTTGTDSNGVKACDDYRYRKFFKMVQFGVPPPAVKQKMIAEGLEPDILDDNRILPDGQTTQPATDTPDDDTDEDN